MKRKLKLEYAGKKVEVDATDLDAVLAAGAALKVLYAEADAAYVQVSEAARDLFDRRDKLSCHVGELVAFVPGPRVDVTNVEGFRNDLREMVADGRLPRQAMRDVVKIKTEVSLDRDALRRVAAAHPEVEAALDERTERVTRQKRTLQWRKDRSKAAA